MGAVMMMPFAGRAILQIRWTIVPPMAWWGMAFMVFFGSVAAYLVYTFALTELTAARVAAFAYLQPVIATALGIWLLGESLTRREVIGGVLILLGVYLSERERGEERQIQNVVHSVA
jgi:drug/metabolite transporter (DMT)-like permease